MKPWMPISGVLTKESSVQRGHVGHPSPEAVRRTAPPVPMRTSWKAKESQATTRTRLSIVVGNHCQNRVARTRSGRDGAGDGRLRRAGRVGDDLALHRDGVDHGAEGRLDLWFHEAPRRLRRPLLLWCVREERDLHERHRDRGEDEQFQNGEHPGADNAHADLRNPPQSE
jgi:hypothetical protein